MSLLSPKRRSSIRCALLVILPMTFLLATASCNREGSPPETQASEAPDGHAEPSSAIIETPPNVRTNLGITFVKVERRAVRGTRRIPGQFELRPEARREYHVMLPGRIELLVKQYARVEAGQPLFHIDSPEWQKIKSELVTALNAMKKSHTDLAVAGAMVEETSKAVEFLEQRIRNLAEASVRKVDLEAELADKQNMLPRLSSELEAARTEFEAAHLRYDVLLSTAASFTGIARETLEPSSDEHWPDERNERPWMTINRITVTAEAPGLVDRVAVTNRGWAGTGDLILDTINPEAIRFHGDALQTDITLFRDGLPARVVPPQGGSINLQDTLDGEIQVGFQAHPGQRTIPIFLLPQNLPAWAKPGVTAYLEVFTEGNDMPVLAIPESSVIRDGLESVFFRRDPSDPNRVIRTEADLGTRDGRWVEIKSGAGMGDEIVLDGVYPLMLASSQSGERMKGGHFHADGTFHADDEE